MVLKLCQYNSTALIDVSQCGTITVDYNEHTYGPFTILPKLQLGPVMTKWL